MFNKIIIPGAWIVAYQFISFVIGFLHRSNVNTWYAFLHKSSLTPPGYVFGIVWPILYIFLALVGYELWHNKLSNRIKAMYVVQMLLNWSWTTIFFGWRLITVSWVFIAVMIMLTLLIMIESYKKSPRITWLLVPYLAWTLFAWYLNFFIWMYN